LGVFFCGWGGGGPLVAVWVRQLSGLIGREWVRVQVEAGHLTHPNKPTTNVPATPLSLA